MDYAHFCFFGAHETDRRVFAKGGVPGFVWKHVAELLVYGVPVAHARRTPTLVAGRPRSTHARDSHTHAFSSPCTLRLAQPMQSCIPSRVCWQEFSDRPWFNVARPPFAAIRRKARPVWAQPQRKSQPVDWPRLAEACGPAWGMRSGTERSLWRVSCVEACATLYST